MGNLELDLPSAPKIPSKGDLTYDSYLKVNDLLALQKPQSNPEHHDEMLFIVIHQAYELWFKLIIHELEKVSGLLEKDHILKAHHFVKRVSHVMGLLVKQIHVLETMNPVDFLYFRDLLKPASGFQSHQFREVEFILGLRDPRYLHFFQHDPVTQKLLQNRLEQKSVRDIFFEMLQRQGYEFSLDDTTEAFDSRVLELQVLYRNPDENLPLYLLTEAFVDLDQNLGLWRDHHVRVIERIIGSRYGTGGSTGVEYLKKTTVKKVFPELWDLRTDLNLV